MRCFGAGIFVVSLAFCPLPWIGISISFWPADALRVFLAGFAVIADKLAFWYVDAAYANPDVEILNAVEPGLATTGGPLILASSPHARRGALWDVFKRHYGAGGDPLILVAHGATRTLNPSLPQRVVDRALEKDRARATAEYLAQFRTDVEGFVALEIVEACTGDYCEMLPAAKTFTELSLIRSAAPMTVSRWQPHTSLRGPHYHRCHSRGPPAVLS